MFQAISSQFLSQNLHFGINLFMALACFVAGWLYFDSATGHHRLAKTAKWVGFFTLALGFLATGINGSDTGTLGTITVLLKLCGYGAIIVGNLLEPLQPRPHTTGLRFSDWRETDPPAKPTPPAPAATPPTPANPPQPATPTVATGTSGPTTNPPTALAIFGLPISRSALALAALPPLGSIIIAILYWRRTAKGLERHLKGVAIAFTCLAVSDGLSLANIWKTSPNPVLQQLVQPLSLLWILEHCILLVSGLLLVRWVWQYLTKRLATQLFLLATSIMVTVVLITSVTMTSLLLASLQKDALTSLETSAKVLRYAVDSKTAGTRATAGLLARTPATADAVAAIDHTHLTSLLDDILATNPASDALITDLNGIVLVRASDPDRYGDSVITNTLVARALAGITATGTITLPGAITPALTVTTATPIKQNGSIVGAALASQVLDNTFVDGIKQTTGLDSTVYAGSTRTATTFTASDGVTRAIGAKETNTTVIHTTLQQGQVWHGLIAISGRPFLATYLPLADADNTVVGMLAIGQPQSVLLGSADQAIKLTYLVAILWLIGSVVPIYFITRYISRQLA